MPHSEIDLGTLLSSYSRKIYMARQVSPEAEAALIQECTVAALQWYPDAVDLDYLQELSAPVRSILVGGMATVLAEQLDAERKANAGDASAAVDGGAA